MRGYYDLGLVALSVVIAIFASYTALDLASRVSKNAATPRKAWTWLVAGAISMGTGIWAMHFIGMLAFHLPLPVAYELPLTWLSMLIAIVVSAIALFVLRRPDAVMTGNLTLGALLMGVGIAAMHYTGMIAMRMSPPITYDPLLFVLSVLIAVLASLAALWIALRLRNIPSRFAVMAKLASAGVMGLAITGMHYTGMAAAKFAPGAMCLAAASGGLENTTLALIVGGIAMVILSLTIVLSTIDGHFAVQNARLAHAAQLSDAALRENEQITAQLRAAQGELMSSARQAGMAEIANGVLHNVGNVLNSVNVSAGLISTRLNESRVDGLVKVAQLLQEHSTDLGAFIASDPRGQRLPGYLARLAEAMVAEQQAVREELGALTRSIDHIKDIVVTQQAYSGSTCLAEPVRVEALLDDAVRMNADSMTRRQIDVAKEVTPLPPVLLDKHLVLQILVNLLSNAKQALEGVSERAHRITMRLGPVADSSQAKVRIEVEDNGEGITAENLARLFRHGFTTRKGGHGFGLHSSALAAQTMGGTLTARSDGPGRGATFTLELPMRIAEGLL
jgi:NO-binding membrane sensor protein with MHYT domain